MGDCCPQRQSVNCRRIRQRLLGALVMVCGGLLTVASHGAAYGEARFAQALKLLKSGSDDQRAVQLLEAAAASGDVGAMYVLGAMNLEGKYVPQDRALGIAS